MSSQVTASLTESCLSDDSALFHAIMAGEPDAQKRAWSRLAPTVRRVVRRFVSWIVDEDDLVQEVFATFFRRLPSLRNPAALRGFAIAIATRTGKYHARRGWRRHQMELLDADGNSDLSHASSEDVGVTHARNRAVRLILRLPLRDRQSFLLRVVAGMSIEEVASSVGASVSTVQRRCTRAQARLETLAQRDCFLGEYVRASSRHTTSFVPSLTNSTV